MIDDVSNPFMATCAQAIEAVARERGHALILCDSHADLRMESGYVGLLTQRRVDGLLIGVVIIVLGNLASRTHAGGGEPA